jgi:hypothetical protein
MGSVVECLGPTRCDIGVTSLFHAMCGCVSPTILLLAAAVVVVVYLLELI